MREILFRAKRKDNGKWIEGGYAEHDGKSFIVIWTRYSPDTRDWDTVEYYENNPQYTSCLIEAIPETVCQYTGLTDKNGRKIFEGDIVKTNNGRLCKVIWFSSRQYQGWDLVPIETKNPAPEEWRIWEDIEKIGNIFDNTELIGDSKDMEARRSETA